MPLKKGCRLRKDVEQQHLYVYFGIIKTTFEGIWDQINITTINQCKISKHYQALLRTFKIQILLACHRLTTLLFRSNSVCSILKINKQETIYYS